MSDNIEDAPPPIDASGVTQTETAIDSVTGEVVVYQVDPFDADVPRKEVERRSAPVRSDERDAKIDKLIEVLSGKTIGGEKVLTPKDVGDIGAAVVAAADVAVDVTP